MEGAYLLKFLMARMKGNIRRLKKELKIFTPEFPFRKEGDKEKRIVLCRMYGQLN
jgi:hypothetical protein